MPIYMKIEGVRGTFDLAETDTLVFTGDDTGGTQATPLVDKLGSFTLTGCPFDDVGELDFAAADGSQEIGDTITFTATVDTYMPTVQHDYDLS